MKTIEALFEVRNARSRAFADYEPGEVAFITNGLTNNGVLGFVKPESRDRVFRAPSLVVSAFCEATVHLPPFVARGNGGSGLIVLVPRTAMTSGQLAYYAACINEALRWRFSWSRQANAERIRNLTLPDSAPKDAEFPVLAAMPTISRKSPRTHWTPRLRRVGLAIPCSTCDRATTTN
ncbi:MAG: hypothetical protein C0506_01285 [Anaerolinea sp.]|nr:hypothetical protein [Anaerolinea sp.]